MIDLEFDAPGRGSKCPNCGGAMESGVVRVGERTSVNFVIPGTPTVGNPIAAFKQGLAGETSDRVYSFAGMIGRRCSACGFLELSAR